MKRQNIARVTRNDAAGNPAYQRYVPADEWAGRADDYDRSETITVTETYRRLLAEDYEAGDADIDCIVDTALSWDGVFPIASIVVIVNMGTALGSYNVAISDRYTGPVDLHQAVVIALDAAAERLDYGHAWDSEDTIEATEIEGCDDPVIPIWVESIEIVTDEDEDEETD